MGGANKEEVGGVQEEDEETEPKEKEKKMSRKELKKLKKQVGKAHATYPTKVYSSIKESFWAL